jgi:hypothetical protein
MVPDIYQNALSKTVTEYSLCCGAEHRNIPSIIQTAYGAHPTSYPMGTGGVKRQGREADHSPQTSAEVKKT